MTTERQKQAAHALADELTRELKPLGVTTATVDDWNDYGGFSIIVGLDMKASHTRNGAFRPVNEKTFDLRAIGAKLAAITRKHTTDFRRDPVQRLYTRYRNERPMFDGYERDYIYLAVEFGWMN
jgi:hypothetical protein